MFDDSYYLAANPGVREAGVDPFFHYLEIGWEEGLDPSTEFSTRGYLEANQDVARSGMQPLVHYAVHGRDEGRSPDGLDHTRGQSGATRFPFDEVFSPTYDSDTAGAGAGPITHYTRTGWGESRGRNDGPVAASQAIRARRLEQGRTVGPASEPTTSEPTSRAMSDGEERPGVQPPVSEDSRADPLYSLFDSRYYLEAHPDVAAAGVDPFEHYMSVGWREGRNPSATFDTAFYLRRNPELAPSGENPLLHYFRVGRAEGRIAKSPITREVEILRGPIVLPTEGSTTTAPRMAKGRLSQALRNAVESRSAGLVVAFSHDVHTENVGGIQIFMSDEQQRLARLGYAYLALSPATFSMRLATTTENPEPFDFVANLDGHTLGRVDESEVRAALDAAGSGGNPRTTFVIHCLLGHRPATLRALYESGSGTAHAYLWLHDYSVLCPSHTLLRNNVRFCGAPPHSSPACGICAYGEARKLHLRDLQVLFDGIECTAVAPSQAALNVWLQAVGHPECKTLVVPHARLQPVADPRQAAESETNRDRPLRIAYCGYPLFHKGWWAFEAVLSAFADDERFEFHHFGAAPADPRPQFHEVQVTRERRFGMVDAIRDAKIDVVLVPTLCHEPFCFVALEAIAGGAYLVTLEGSGNVEALARSRDDAEVYPGISELIEALGTGSLAQAVHSAKSAGVSHTLELTGTMASIIGARS